MSIEGGRGWRGKGMKRVGKYEMGRTIGQGTFAKVKFAVDRDTGHAVAIKVLAKSTILKHKMVHQVSLSLYLVLSDCSFAVTYPVINDSVFEV
jgi:serine/threonine protein kinase